MVMTESVTITVPIGMSKYLNSGNIDIYDKLGYSYLDMTMDDLDAELETFRQLKKRKRLRSSGLVVDGREKRKNCIIADGF